MVRAFIYGSDEDGDDSDAELQALCGTEADKTSKATSRARLEQSDGGNDPLLSRLLAVPFWIVEGAREIAEK